MQAKVNVGTAPFGPATENRLRAGADAGAGCEAHVRTSG